MSRIFISYRREDTATSVGRLADSLGEYLPHAQIFQDISSIDPGADFVDTLQQALADCAAVLVVIGPKWLSIADRQGRRKLDDPDDWVRQEIVAALKRRGVRVFPLLVEGANMPPADELPDTLKRLARRQAHELTVRHWAKDVAALAEILKRVPALADEAPPAAASATSKAAEPAVNNPGEPGAASQPTSPPTPEPATSGLPHGAGSQSAGGAATGAPDIGSSGGSQPKRPAWKAVAAAAAILAVGLAIWFNPSRDEPEPAPPVVVAPPTATTPPAAATPAPAASTPPAPRPPADGETFRDCVECPEMVAVPVGTFTMGSPAAEKGSRDDEGPQHPVSIARFALGRTAVTVGEFRRFVEARGYKTEAERKPAEGIVAWDAEKGEWVWSAGKSWRDTGFSQDERHPVVGVSWNDARAYVEWLAAKTGKAYRLPSEGEREYATRAGTATSRWWGDDASRACHYANAADRALKAKDPNWRWAIHECDDGYVYTAPVGSFEPNAFGLQDMIGNVWEWTQDCWNENYEGAPADGKAWESGDCGRRVVRGGSWFFGPGDARAAGRGRFVPGGRDGTVGFRLARTL